MIAVTIVLLTTLVLGLALMRPKLTDDQRSRYIRFWGVGTGALLVLSGVAPTSLRMINFFGTGAAEPAPPRYIAYNVPDKMTLDRSHEIAFLIRGEYDENELVGEIRRLTGDSSAVVETDPLPTTRRMSVRLAGGAFEIVPHSNETQLVEPSAAWLWEVYPREKGEEKLLTLTVSQLYDVGGRETPRDSQIVRREIVVRVGFLKAVGSFAKSNWFWLGPLVLAVVGYIWRNPLRRLVQKIRNRLPKLKRFKLVPPEETSASTDQVESSGDKSQDTSGP